MAIDFTLVLITCAGTPARIFEAAELALMRDGFWRDREVVVSGESTEDEQILLVDSIAAERDRLEPWASIYMEFSCTDFSGLGVQIDSMASGPGHCFLSLSRGTMLDLHRDGIPSKLYTAFAIFARFAKSDVGVGGFAISRDEISITETWARLRLTPADRDLWAEVLVEPTAAVTMAEQVAWESAFEQVEVEDYTFFVDKDLLRNVGQPAV
jgi:hypothetical protein